MLELSKVDLARLDMLLKALKRCKTELEGEEILAFAQSWHWLASFAERVRLDIMQPPPLAMAPAAEPPKAVEDPKPEAFEPKEVPKPRGRKTRA